MKWLDRFAEQMLLSPLLWGGMCSFAFHVALDRSPIKLSPWLHQRLTGQWESYICTTLFLMAVAFLVIRGIRLAIQSRAWQRYETDELEAGGKPVALEKSLEALGSDLWAKRSWLYRRLQDVQQFSLRSDAASSLTTHLKELSDADHDRLHTDYGLLRTLIWTIPSCGSVATILAIAKVVENLSSENSADVLAGAATGLSGAFNLFAFSVGLAIVLVVLKFGLEQAEQLMLAAIDKQVSRAMSAKVGEQATQPSSQFNQLQQLTDVLKSVANSLATQPQTASRMPAVAPAGGASMKDIESVVQTAITTAMQRQPAMSIAGEPAAIDSAGWKGLQHVLQKLVHVLEQQNAKLESEGRVTKQLTTIIDEGLKETHDSLRIHESRQAAVVSGRL